MARAAANFSRLQFAMRIPERNLSRTDNEDLRVYDMCALTVDEILLSCGRVGGAAGLRAVSLRTAQLAAYEPTALQNVYRVAFDAHTDTLLVLVGDSTYRSNHLVSLRRNASEWLEVQRLKIEFSYFGPTINYVKFAVCDSRVLLIARGGNTKYVFDVSAERTLRDAGSVTWHDVHDVACTRRDGVTLVAFSHSTSVSLLRLTYLPLRFEQLARVSLTGPLRLLFREDLLLVNFWNHATRSHAIVSFRVSGNALTERREFFDHTGIVDAWAFAGDRIVLYSWGSKDLLVYAFT